jgi:hypothetical protein
MLTYGDVWRQSMNRWDVPVAKRLTTLAFTYDHHLFTVFCVVALMTAPFLYGTCV